MHVEPTNNAGPINSTQTTDPSSAATTWPVPKLLIHLQTLPEVPPKITPESSNSAHIDYMPLGNCLTRP